MGYGGANAVSLPRDAIFDILSWAPVRSMCRFRCVSKEWLALISDPAFVAQHRSRTAPEPLIVAGHHGEKHSMLVMNLEGNIVREIKGLGAFPTVRSCFDNLACVCDFGFITHVVDVVTGKVLVAWFESEIAKVSAVSLGRAAGSNSIKLVRLTRNSLYGDPSHQTCHVITLGYDDSEWRRAPSPTALLSLSNFDSSCATVNGVAYFLCSTYGTPHSVLGFDLESEEWIKTIQRPRDVGSESWSKTGPVRLSGLNETLCMIQTEALCMIETEERQTDHQCTNIWLLVDGDKSIWIKAYRIPMVTSLDIIEPLMVTPDGVKLLLYYRSKHMPVHALRVYDPSAGTCTDVMKLPENTFHKIGVCNLRLDCFVTHRPDLTVATPEKPSVCEVGSIDACR